jgi:hypothetical protein
VGLIVLDDDGTDASGAICGLEVFLELEAKEGCKLGAKKR